MRRYWVVFIVLFGLISCRSGKYLVKKEFKNNSTFSQNFTGFTLFDLQTNTVVFEKNAHNYFQPASNNKLFTMYAGLKSMGDSVPALHYITRGDSLIFWGTGDPSLLHPDLQRSNVIDFLKNRSEKLFFSTSNEVVNKFGPGWMLEDYNEYYQAEITTLPIYGNIVRYKNQNQKLIARPYNVLIEIGRKNTNKEIVRNLDSNLVYLPNESLSNNFSQDVPFKSSTTLLAQLLSDTLKKEIFVVNKLLPASFKTLYSIKADSIYKRMLLVSDNMMAEQIILLASKSDTLSTQKSIAHILKTHLADLPDKPRWVDGSGLSRYNLTTPRNLVYVLNKIYKENPKERIYDLMPKIIEGIYAKTGSYSNNYNMSGYLIGKSGKIYSFSFMNNNFMVPTKDIRKEVERILVNLGGRL